MSETENTAQKTLKTGVVMDPISDIKTYKDSTFAMLLEAQSRGHAVFYMEPGSLFAKDGRSYAEMSRLQVRDNSTNWFTFEAPECQPLDALDIVLMRRDPPFDMNYIYTTYMLELAEQAGTLIINRPQSLRDANEKFFITNFPQCCVPMVISSSSSLRGFAPKRRMETAAPSKAKGGMIALKREPSDSRASTIGVVSSTRRPTLETTRSMIWIPDTGTCSCSGRWKA